MASLTDEINAAAGYGRGAPKKTGHALTDEINAAAAAMTGSPVPPQAQDEERIGLTNFMNVIPGVKGFRDSTLKPVATAIRSLEGSGPDALIPTDISVPLLGDIPSQELPLYGPNLPVQELIPGMGYMTDYAKRRTIEEASKSAKKPGGGTDLGVMANVLSGLPGAAANTATDVGLELAAQMFESAPENVAFPFMGKATGAIKGAAGTAGNFLMEQTPTLRKAVGSGAATYAPKLTAAMKQAVNDLPSWLTHRGGFDPGAKESFAAYDTGTIKAAHAAEEAALPFAEISGRATTPQERTFMEMLQMQPEQRAHLLSLPPDVPVSINPAYQAAAREVPGIPGALQAAMTMTPESNVPARTFAQQVEAFSRQSGLAKAHVEAAYGKDPTSWSRLNADNWFPQDFAGTRVSTFPMDASSPMRERTGFMEMRGDVSWEARQALGPTDPVERAYSKIYQEHRAATTRELFNDLSLNPIVTYRAGLGGPMEAQEISMMRTGERVWKEGTQYVRMADDAKLGPLSGQLVKSQEAAELNAMIRNPGVLRRTLNRWWSSWKFEKTVLNPKTHIRNLTANVMMAHAEGLSPYRLDVYRKALQELKAGGAGWKEARAAGASWTTRARPSVLDDILAHSDLDESEDAYEAFFSALPRWMMKNKGAQAMARGYQDSEALFKHAVYLYKRELGIPIHQAIGEADRALINYAQMPQWVKQLRTMPGGIPFISFTYGVTPLVVNAAMTKPQIFLRYKLFADSWNELALARTGATDEERHDLKTLFAGTVPLVEMNRDASGSLKVYDAARNTPVSDFLPDRTDIGGMAGLVGNVALKNPLLSEAALWLTGRDPRTKQDVVPMEVPGAQAGANAYGVPAESQSLLFDVPRQETSRALREHLLRTVTPGPVGDITNIAEVARGRPSYTGERVPVSDALFSALYGPTKSLNEEKTRAGMRLLGQQRVAESAHRKKARREGR